MAKKYVERWLKCDRIRPLTGDDILAMMYMYQQGFTRYRIAKVYGCSWKHVHNIVTRKYKFTSYGFTSIPHIR